MIDYMDRCQFPDRFIRSKMECKEGLFGLGGSGNKTDRNFQLGSWGNLNNLGNWENAFGQGQQTQGAGNLSTAENFFSTLTSGNRGQVGQVLAPEISTIQGQTQQALDTTSEFGNRSGGTNASTIADTTTSSAEIQNMIDTLLSGSAAELGSLGLGQLTAGENASNLAETAFSTVGSQAGNDRAQVAAPYQQSVQGDILDAGLNANVFGGQSLSGLLFGA